MKRSSGHSGTTSFRQRGSSNPTLRSISAGFDSRVDDPLGSFTVDDVGFRELTRIMLEIANISGEGRLVSVLEGGYNPAGLASAVEAHLGELEGLGTCRERPFRGAGLGGR